MRTIHTNVAPVNPIAVTLTRPGAADILHARIQRGLESAKGLFEALERDLPTDSIVRSGAMAWSSTPAGQLLMTSKTGDAHVAAVDTRTVSAHAQGQVAERAGIPAEYLRRMLGGDDGKGGQDWARELAAHALNQHYGAGRPGDRFLVRSVRDQVRGFLSDKFRRLDSRPLADAVAKACADVGAQPYDGSVSETRVALKVVLPQILEPVPGEYIAIGGEWSNSDFGAGTNSFRWFMLRCWCLNGAVGEVARKEIHLGRRLEDDIEFSQKTYQLDTRAAVSAMGDVVRGTLGPKKVEEILAAIKNAADRQVDWKSAPASVLAKLTKSEAKFARDAFEGQDVVNLPAGRNAWRMSNAISWLANHTPDADRKLELERVAGQIVAA